MFNKILMGENKDLNVLCFLWRYNYIDPIGDYRMNVNLFGKVNCLCIVNWTIKNHRSHYDEPKWIIQ